MCTDGTDRTGWQPSQFDDEDGLIVRRAAQELEEKARLARSFAYGFMAIGVISLVTLAGAALYQGSQVRSLVHDAVQRQEDQRVAAEATSDLVSCVFGKLDLHQQQADIAFREFARRSGFTLPGEPIDPPKVNQDEVRMACERAEKAFKFQTGGSSGNRPGG